MTFRCRFPGSVYHRWEIGRLRSQPWLLLELLGETVLASNQCCQHRFSSEAFSKLASFFTHYDFQTLSKSILTLTGFFCSWLPRAVGSWQHQSIAKNKRLSCYQTRQGKGTQHIYVQIHGLIQHKDCNFPELMRKRSTKSGFCIQTIFHCLDIIGSRSSKWLESSNGIP